MKYLLPLCLLLLALIVVSPSPAAAQGACRFFAETAFNVCDDSQAQFLTAFNGYGLSNLGYPISRRYERDGFVTQAFQKAILQWRADSDSVAFVNVFDDLSRQGLDQRLNETRQTPFPLPAGWGGSTDFATVRAKREALLSDRPAIRTLYFAASAPLDLYGLPTSTVTDMGNHYAIRTQRAVFQEWKETVPWAQAGQVTIANGGTIAQEMGLIPATALTHESGAVAPAPVSAPAPAAPAPAPASSTGQVVIQNVYYDGGVYRVESDEYAVIANTGSGPVNLAGWMLNAGDNGQNFRFPDHVLAAGASCRVYTNQVHPESCGFSFGKGSAIWNNGGDCGFLYDPSGALVDQYCY